MAVAANQARRHLRITVDTVFVTKALALFLARTADALTNQCRAFRIGRVTCRQLLEAHGRNIYVYVYAIKKRPWDASYVWLNLQGRAAAFARRVFPEAASPWVLPCLY